ncbi:YjdF family protein [Enterococcus sp. MJM12]|uniref:YjdF family protein n=1 Tax=Candidatus Enterococcus myersii TaxID=2815322 RepID=A0ABS3H812_9ENTE|nr:YjdF family protein [Enterococcus sp. MJM12]MBO0448758.1 YjdF family protein [Enterococcus sp. MJM12]
MKLTIFFDGSFWCGLVEDEDDGKMKVLKHVFGPEPKDTEVLAFVNTQLLAEMVKAPSVSMASKQVNEHRINPKRLQRLVNKEKNQPVYSTKAQIAMQKSIEIKKTQRQKAAKAQKQEEAQRRFQLKQEKKLQKKKGH